MLEPDFDVNHPLILIADQEKTLRLLYRRVLVREGYQLEEASNGEECLHICSRRLPDLIVMDGIMPQIDGFTCCEKLQKRFGKNCPPILMVTALDDEESVKLAFEKGASEYLTKPINWAVLQRFSQKAIRLKRMDE